MVRKVITLSPWWHEEPPFDHNCCSPKENSLVQAVTVGGGVDDVDGCVVCRQPMHDDYDLRQEQLNKASILSTKKFLEGLLEMFNTHVVSLAASSLHLS